MVQLIPFALAHFTTLAGWFGSERELVQWGGSAVAFPLSVEQMQKMLAEGHGEQPSRLCWMAASADGIVGHAQLGFDWRNGSATLSRVAIAPHMRGRGFAVPILRLVVAEAFSRPDIERLELNVYSWNTPAIRTYQRLGFVTEGCRRSSTRAHGERWDTTIMGLLRSEWTSGQSS